MLDSIFYTPHFNLVFLSIQFGYSIFSIFLMLKYLIKDLRNPYLGISSTYIFNYFVCSIFALVLPLLYETNMTLTADRACLWYLLSLGAVYNAVIFFIKKYNYTKASNETKLTLFLEFMMFFSILAISIGYKTYNPQITVKNINDYWYYLVCKYYGNFPLRDWMAFLKTIPLVTLGFIWFKSSTKKYNKQELSYFVKSANKPIISFFIYELVILVGPFLDLTSQYEILVGILTVEFFRIYFCFSVLDWLKHPDMEAIERNMIIRSEKRWLNR